VVEFRTKDLVAFIKARHDVFLRREAGKKKPWTKDPILQNYRFCNVYRELDSVTIWIRQNITEKYADQRNYDLWFQFVLARLLNLPASLAVAGYIAFAYDQRVDGLTGAQRLIKNLHALKASGSNVFNGAYIVSTNGQAMDKVEYIANKVLTPLWKSRDEMRPHPREQLRDFYGRLVSANGMGTFMAAQVCADLKFAWPSEEAWIAGGPPYKRGFTWGTNKRVWPEDFWSFAASGPGSRRGLNRVLQLQPEDPWKESQWLGALEILHQGVAPAIKKLGMPRLSAQDLQNCLCEFDKYERVRLGEGVPKQRYEGVK